MADRTLVIDANVLLRAVLGSRVSDLLERFALIATFLAPETAFDEAHEHMAAVLQKRGAPAGALQLTVNVSSLIATACALHTASSRSAGTAF